MRRGHASLETRDALEGAIEQRPRQLTECLPRFANRIDPMTYHCEVVTGIHREAKRLREAVLVVDRAHVEIIGHDEAIEAEIVAQKIRHDGRRKGRGQLPGVETRIPAVTDHHAVHALRESPKYGELVRLQFFA